MTQKFYSHGKLLLTGEYVVLDGARSLALPTKQGQSLVINTNNSKILNWKSVLHDGSTWFETSFNEASISTSKNEDPIIDMLLKILAKAQELNPRFEIEGRTVQSTLEFERSWGLGSSSTLINNVSRWAQVDPYLLLQKTFGGSGYDIACASAKGPITYQISQNGPIIENSPFDPDFKEELFFVYLNKKQNSRESIQHYRAANKENLSRSITEISQISELLAKAKDISIFEELINTHELIISELIKSPTVKKQRFPDYPRAIKSLGGWGGDFILAMGTHKDMDYFRDKGYYTTIPYEKMIL